MCLGFGAFHSCNSITHSVRIRTTKRMFYNNFSPKPKINSSLEIIKTKSQRNYRERGRRGTAQWAEQVGEEKRQEEQEEPSNSVALGMWPTEIELHGWESWELKLLKTLEFLCIPKTESGKAWEKRKRRSHFRFYGFLMRRERGGCGSWNWVTSVK